MISYYDSRSTLSDTTDGHLTNWILVQDNIRNNRFVSILVAIRFFVADIPEDKDEKAFPTDPNMPFAFLTKCTFLNQCT